MIRDQIRALWGAVRERRVLLPTAFLFLWSATPSCDAAFTYFMTNDLGFGPELLGRARLASSAASLFGVWLYQRFLRGVPVSKVLLGTTIAGVPLGLTQLLVVTHFNRELGIPDAAFVLGDDVVLTVLGQLAFMPTLVLAARLCPPGVEGTLFATLMSVYNGAGVVGAELGAALTAALGVTERDFTSLPTLVAICTLSSLLPLPLIGWVREAEEGEPIEIDVTTTTTTPSSS